MFVLGTVANVYSFSWLFLNLFTSPWVLYFNFIFYLFLGQYDMNTLTLQSAICQESNQRSLPSWIRNSWTCFPSTGTSLMAPTLTQYFGTKIYRDNSEISLPRLWKLILSHLGSLFFIAMNKIFWLGRESVWGFENKGHLCWKFQDQIQQWMDSLLIA